MSATRFSFPLTELPAESRALRSEVRAFLAEQQEAAIYTPNPLGWTEHNREFSRKLGERGWIGMTWPKAYGGHERSALVRYVVTEELLASGAPIRAHWASDRQIGPLILQYGSEWQKQTFLPKFASGGLTTAVGLSEPDSGSDLAAIRTRAEKVDGGWRVEGRKIWITNAHNADYLSLFARTATIPDDRHGGITRFLVDMKSDGIGLRPIRTMTGHEELSEIIFDGVFVPDRMVIGDLGGAWSQVSSELAHERSSPDRWTAFLPLLVLLIERLGPAPDRSGRETIGRLVSHLWTLRGMSLSIAGVLGRGGDPGVAGSIVKDLGTHFDEEIPHAARRLVPEAVRAALGPDDPFNAYLFHSLLFSPALTIRGGTREILRNAIARGLGLR